MIPPLRAPSSSPGSKPRASGDDPNVQGYDKLAEGKPRASGDDPNHVRKDGKVSA